MKVPKVRRIIFSGKRNLPPDVCDKNVLSQKIFFHFHVLTTQTNVLNVFKRFFFSFKDSMWNITEPLQFAMQPIYWIDKQFPLLKLHLCFSLTKDRSNSCIAYSIRTVYKGPFIEDVSRFGCRGWVKEMWQSLQVWVNFEHFCVKDGEGSGKGHKKRDIICERPLTHTLPNRSS